jgi:hypothetical protein
MGKHVNEFQYIDDRGNKGRAKLSPAHYPSTGITHTGTEDPQWHIFNAVTGDWFNAGEWLLITGTDGFLWKTRVHAEYKPLESLVHVWMTSKHRDDDDGENPTLGIIDWEGNKWHMKIDARVANDVAPGFEMIPY